MPRAIVPTLRQLKALSFLHGTTQHINYGSDGSLDDLDPITVLVWVNLDTLHATERNLVLGKATAADATGLQFYLGHTASNDKILLERQTDATWSAADAATSNFTSWGIGKWVFAAAVIEIGVAPRLLVGDLTSPPTEPSSYTTQASGTGSIVTDAAQNLYVGNGRNLGSNLRTGGDIAFVHVIAANLSNAEIVAQWQRFRKLPETRLVSRPGMDGPGIQIDHSGRGNHGTLTGGPIVAQGPPLVERRVIRLWALSTSICDDTTNKKRGSYPQFAPMTLPPCPDGTID